VLFAILLVMFVLARNTNITNRGLFSDWRDALTAYRATRSAGERIFLVALQFACMLRVGLWGFLAAAATAMGTAIAALCGVDWAAILREIRLGLRDWYYALRSNPPSVGLITDTVSVA
jgi:hypothetical protein